MDLFKKIEKLNPYSRTASDGLLSDVKYHTSTGSYLFNGMLSGSIFKGCPGNRTLGFAGKPSTGKTYLTLSILKNFLEESPNNRVIYFDSENSVETDMLLNMNIDCTRFKHCLIDSLENYKTQMVQIINLIKEDKKAVEDKKGEFVDKYFFVLDSLAQLPSNKELEDAKKGDPKGDMGTRAKIIRSIFRTIHMDLGILQYPMIITSHTYSAMSQYSPDGVAGGEGLIYAASIIIELHTSKDKDGKKVNGIFMKALQRKSRFTKQFMQIPIRLSFSTGLDKYFGLVEMCLERGIVKKQGRKLLFPDGGLYYPIEIYTTAKDKIFTDDFLKIVDAVAENVFSYGKDELEITDSIKSEDLDENMPVEITEEEADKYSKDSDEIQEISVNNLEFDEND